MPVFDATRNQVLFSPVTNYYQGKAIRQQLAAGEVDLETKRKALEQADTKLGLEGRRVDALEDSVAAREEANAQAREAMEYKIGQERTAKTAYDLYVMTEKHNRRFAKAGKTEEAMAETLKNVVPDIQAYADSLPEELAEEKAKINEYLADGIVTPEEWRGMSESAAEQARYYHPSLFAEGKPTVLADGAMALMPDGSIVENRKDFAPNTGETKPTYDPPNAAELDAADELINKDPMLDGLSGDDEDIAKMILANDIRQLQEDLGIDYVQAAEIALNQLKRKVTVGKGFLFGKKPKLNITAKGLEENEYLGTDGNVYIEEQDGSFRRK